MFHNTQTFNLIDKTGKSVSVRTREYNFEVEDIVKKRIGEDAFNDYQVTGQLELNITLKAVQEDFPKLLTGKGLRNIDWKKQNYDTLQEIYFFFIRFRKNASLRHLESEKETLLSNFEMMEKIILSLPESIYQRLNYKRSSGN